MSVIPFPQFGSHSVDYSRLVDPRGVRETAVRIAAPLAPPIGSWSMAQGIELFHYVRALPYIADPAGVFYVQPPTVTLQLGAGNCQAKALALTSLYRSIGIPSRLALVFGGGRAHLLTQLCIGPYDMTALSADLAARGSSASTRAKYVGICPRQYVDTDASGNRWLITDATMSEFAGDVEQLVQSGFMYRSSAGAPYTNPPTYFSDGADLPEVVSLAGTDEFRLRELQVVGSPA